MKDELGLPAPNGLEALNELARGLIPALERSGSKPAIIEGVTRTMVDVHFKPVVNDLLFD